LLDFEQRYGRQPKWIQSASHTNDFLEGVRYPSGVLWMAGGEVAPVPDLWEPREVEDLPWAIIQALPEVTAAWCCRDYWVGVGHSRVAIARRDSLPLGQLSDLAGIKHEFLGGQVMAAIIIPPHGCPRDDSVWVIEVIDPPQASVDSFC
jgi:hypothetical protein